jgi:hypothetical protein
MSSRRKFLIDLWAAFAYAPFIGRAATLMPIERSYLGFVDRLRIDCQCARRFTPSMKERQNEH